MNNQEKVTRPLSNTTDSKRTRLVYAIGIIAFFIAAASLAFTVKDFLTEFKAAGQSIAAISYTTLATMAVDIVFSALEIITGFSLIKQWKSGESIEMHKTVSKLIKIVVYETFIAAISNELIAYLFPSAQFQPRISMLYVVLYFIYSIFTSSTSILIKRNELMKLFYLMLFSSLTGAVLIAFETALAIIGADGIDVCFEIAKLILLILIFTFALATVIFYTKNPTILRRDIEASEDSDLIKKTATHEYLRVYSNRAQESKINIFINTLYFIGLALGTAGTVFFLIEQNAERLLTSTFFGTVEIIKNELFSFNIESSYGILLLFLIVLIYPLSYIAAASGIIKRDSRSKISIVTLSAIGTTILIFTNISLIIDIVLEVIKYRSIDLKSIPIMHLAIIALFIAYTVIQKITKNKNKDLFDAVTNGDSYRKHIKKIHKAVIMNGAFSIASLIALIVLKLTNQDFAISYILYAVSTGLIMIGTQLELKHPFSEYVKVKRKIITPPEADTAVNTVE